MIRYMRTCMGVRVSMHLHVRELPLVMLIWWSLRCCMMSCSSKGAEKQQIQPMRNGDAEAPMSTPRLAGPCNATVANGWGSSSKAPRAVARVITPLMQRCQSSARTVASQAREVTREVVQELTPHRGASGRRGVTHEATKLSAP